MKTLAKSTDPFAGHTPGPWETAATSLEQIQIVTIDPKRDQPNGIVAVVHRVGWCNDGEDRANAKLIARCAVAASEQTVRTASCFFGNAMELAGARGSHRPGGNRRF